MTDSQEEYLKTIYLLKRNDKKVRITDIANKLSFKKPSVTKGIKTLKEMGFLNYEAYGEITLTKKGEETARNIIKKYDILNMFLTEVLEIDEKIAKNVYRQVIYKNPGDKVEVFDGAGKALGIIFLHIYRLVSVFCK